MLSVNVDTRSVDAKYSYELIKHVTVKNKDNAILFSKRIDSTLRGNIGSEIDGVLDGLCEGYKAA